MCGRLFCDLSVHEIKELLGVSDVMCDLEDDYKINDYNIAPGNKAFCVSSN